MLARYLYFHVEAELDADLASDLVFAEYVSEEKIRFLPAGVILQI